MTDTRARTAAGSSHDHGNCELCDELERTQAVKERDYMAQKVECLRVQSDARAEEIAAQSHMQEEQEKITLAWQSRCREQVEEIAFWKANDVARIEEIARLRAELEAQLDSEHGAHAMAERLCIQHAKELQAAVAAERQVCIEIAVGVANKYPSWAEDHQIGSLDVAAALRAPTPTDEG